MGAWCRADLEVPGRERQCPMRVGTGLQPELRRVVGEGLGMPHEEFVVSGCRPGAPLAGLRDTAALAQDAAEIELQRLKVWSGVWGQYRLLKSGTTAGRLLLGVEKERSVASGRRLGCCSCPARGVAAGSRLARIWSPPAKR